MNCIECNGTYCAFCAHSNMVNYEESNVNNGETHQGVSQ